MPKVSIISGYYNRADYLEATVASALNQTFRDIELLVFDDASSDNTKLNMEDLAKRLGDSRFKPIYHGANKGFTQGMIDAIAQCKGDYIAVLGSGDIALPDRIAEQVAYLDANPDVGVVGCWYTNVVAETGARRPRQPNANGVDFTRLLKGNVFSHGEVMIRKSVYDTVGGYRAAFRNCQDYDLWLRISKISKLATIPKYLYDRYVRMDGVSYNPQKFLVQARYFLLTQRIAQMDEASAIKAIETLRINGPMSLVELADPALQSRFLKASARSIVWGASKEAEALARAGILSFPKRMGIILVAKVLSWPVGRPLRAIVQKAFGVQ